MRILLTGGSEDLGQVLCPQFVARGKDAFDFWQLNVTGTFTLLECCARAGCKDIVFISSTSVDDSRLRKRWNVKVPAQTPLTCLGGNKNQPCISNLALTDLPEQLLQRLRTGVPKTNGG